MKKLIELLYSKDVSYVFIHSKYLREIKPSSGMRELMTYKAREPPREALVLPKDLIMSKGTS